MNNNLKILLMLQSIKRSKSYSRSLARRAVIPPPRQPREPDSKTNIFKLLQRPLIVINWSMHALKRRRARSNYPLVDGHIHHQSCRHPQPPRTIIYSAFLRMLD
jgi:hypothetical protein